MFRKASAAVSFARLTTWTCVLAGLSVLTGFNGGVSAVAPLGDDCDTPSYEVAVRDTTFFYVRMSFRAPEGPQRLFLPETSPGGLRETYARFVEELRAEADRGDAVSARRVAASAWEVDVPPGVCVTVFYLVRRHADDPIRLVSNDLTPDGGYFVGATLLLGLESHTSTSASLEVEAPDGWGVWSTLRSTGPASFTAGSYEEVARAPVLLGRASTREVALDPGSLRLVAFGAPSDSTLDTIAGRFGEIARCHQRIFGAPAADTTLVGLRWRRDLDLGGGVARRDAVVLNIGREWMADPARFASATFAHEYFHTWNFGLFHPADSRPWRPFGPTATRSLWLVEGLTNYYVLQTFVRLGRMTADGALAWLGSEITNLETSPARAWASLEDGGPMADARAVAFVDVRAGGFVAGFVLDALIRRETAGRASLDDVVRALAREARDRGYGGYTSDDIERVVRSVGGDRAAGAYTRLVSEPGPADYAEMLDGTPYRVSAVPAPEGDGSRWTVERRPDGGHGAGGANPLTISCDRSS